METTSLIPRPLLSPKRREKGSRYLTPARAHPAGFKMAIKQEGGRRQQQGSGAGDLPPRLYAGTAF